MNSSEEKQGLVPKLADICGKFGTESTRTPDWHFVEDGGVPSHPAALISKVGSATHMAQNQTHRHGKHIRATLLTESRRNC